MTETDALGHIRNGVRAGLVQAVLTAIVLILAFASGGSSETLEYFGDPLVVIDLVILLLLVWGLSRHWRIAGIVLILWLIVGTLDQIADSGQVPGLIGLLIFGYCYIQATRGCFALAQHTKQARGPEDRPLRRFSFVQKILIGLGGLVGLAVAAVIALGLLVTFQVFPDTLVRDGADLPPKVRAGLEGRDLLTQDEFVRKYYFTGLFSFYESGVLLTNRRLISFYQEEDETYSVETAEVGDILTIEQVTEGGFSEDSVWLVRSAGDPASIYFYLSVEEDGEAEFVDAVRAAIR